MTIPGIWKSFVTSVKSLPQKIKQWFTNVLQPIKDFDWKQFGYDVGQKVGTAVKNIIDAFKKFFTQTLPQVWETVKSSFKTFFTKTLPTFFTKTIPTFFKTVKDSFVKFFTKTLPKALSNIGQWFKDVGQAIWDGIKEGWNTAIKAISDFITGFVDGFKDALGIHSPSTVFRDEIGKFLAQGLLEGLAAPFKKVASWVKTNIITPVSNAIKNNPISDIVVKIANNAKDWWDNAKNWWSGVSKGGVSLQAFVDLVKNKWETVKGWIGKIPTLSQFINLAKEKWSSVKEWIGNIPIVEQGIKLTKHLWTTVKNWVGNIPTLNQYIQLLKERWSTVKEWIGNIPTLSQYIKLLKERWSTVKEWIGNIPVLSQYIALAKHLWTTVKNWIGNIPVLSQGISLLKSGWSAVSTWVKNFMGGAVEKGISLGKSGWNTVAAWVKDRIGGAVTVTVDLVSKWKNNIKKFFGLSGGGVVAAGGGIKMYASGGIITPNMWKAMPKYAGGTNNAHGSMFVAGENGAELVGHVNGTTEVLNRFQLASVMHSSIVSGMAQFSGYWQSMSRDIVTCANGIINAVLVSANTVNDGLVLASASGYDPTCTLSQSVYETSQKANRYAEESMYNDMRDFYHDYMESSINRMVAATERQADKEEKTIVQVGNRTINDAVTTQKKANGYSFTE